jgi:hypothetical protein
MGMNSINKGDIGNLQRDGNGVSLMRINEHNRVCLKSSYLQLVFGTLFTPYPLFE